MFACAPVCVKFQVTVHTKGSLIIVGVIMEISVSLTIVADDKKKNNQFWCFCFLISRPLEISRGFYYRACVLPCLSSFSISIRRLPLPCAVTSSADHSKPTGM